MSESRFLKDLNPPQRRAVETTEGPVLVIAGAGSGKTRVITHRIAYLIEEKGVEPWAIFAATFTNKAAREMKRRVAFECRSADIARLPIATFHSHCATVLRAEAEAAGLTPRFTICDAADQIALLRDAIREMGHNPKHLAPRDVQEVISLAKMRLLEEDEAARFIDSARDATYAAIYRLYQKRLRESDALDFDDLLLRVVRLWTANPALLEAYQKRFRYVLVDEYQDTNLAQFELVRLLTEAHRNLCVVGDEDQSIYSWRGAEITNLLEFQKHFPEAETIRLEQNYRSTGNILKAAGAVIDRNTQRLGKELWTDGGPGDPLVVIDATSEREEAREVVRQIENLIAGGLPTSEIALFYRVNALSRVYEEALREEGIPYRVIGGVGFYDRMEIKDLLAYLQVLVNPGNALALLRIINTPKRGLGKKAVDSLLAYAERKRMALFEVIMDAEHIKEAGLKGKAAKALLALANSFVAWTAMAPSLPLRILVETILADTDYIAELGDPRSIEVIARTDNIEEFLGALDEYAEQAPDGTLDVYLESVALRAAGDARSGEKNDEPSVSLMTVHNAKGLEFDVVFIVALEKDLFPNARAVRDQGHAEEERRLFYVALTRARKRLYLSYAMTRMLYGRTEWPSPSLFLREIPRKCCVPIDEADLGPVTPTRAPRRAPQSAPPPSAGAPAEAAKPKRFAHAMLGEVEIVSEEGVASQRRLVVRDDRGERHTLMAAHANLKPIAAPTEAESLHPEDDEDLPF